MNYLVYSISTYFILLYTAWPEVGRSSLWQVRFAQESASLSPGIPKRLLDKHCQSAPSHSAGWMIRTIICTSICLFTIVVCKRTAYSHALLLRARLRSINQRGVQTEAASTCMYGCMITQLYPQVQKCAVYRATAAACDLGLRLGAPGWPWLDVVLMPHCMPTAGAIPTQQTWNESGSCSHGRGTWLRGIHTSHAGFPWNASTGLRQKALGLVRSTVKLHERP